jgi:predicted signal transduction protein with EAL and GGDEF domain
MELRTLLARPVVLGDCTAELGASVGIATAPEDAQDVERLLQKADIAIRHARQLPQGVQVFDKSLDLVGPRRLSLARDLSAALGQGDLECAYQPQVRLSDGGLEGVEVLARWRHPELGVVTPAEFVPIAESSGSILTLTEHVLRRALDDCADWLASEPEARLSLNVSVRCLHYSTLADQLVRIVDEAGATPERVVLEITESSLMADVSRFVAAVKQLADAGFDISIDDFGVGYSSLAYLQVLPVGELKLDRQFMRDLHSGRVSAAIVSSVLGLAAMLDIRTVGEGIEDAATMTRLRELGCDLGQGYLIARPMDAGGFAVWRESHAGEIRAPGRPRLLRAAGSPAASNSSDLR